MPTTHDVNDGDEKNHRVRKELQNLPKQDAPWYFESQLRQRILKSRSKNAFWEFFARPLPAYALSIFLLAGLGVFGYNLFFAPSPLQHSTELEDNRTPPEAQIGNEQPQPAATQPPIVGPTTNAGATDGFDKPVLEQRVAQTPPVQSGPRGRVREFELPVTAVGGRQSSGAVSRSLDDSMVSMHVARDSSDSLGLKKDSIRIPDR